MAGFKLDRFRGLRPRVSATKLAVGEAVTAQNLKLGSGDLEPIPDKLTVEAVSSGRSPITIYRFDNSGSPIWFQWDEDVDVVRGPVKDDTLERTYYTGCTIGTDKPKMTTNELADQGGGGPYPESWLYVGVPAPELAPTTTKTPLPEDSEADTRRAYSLRSDSVLIDLVKWTEYPGTGTRNQTWRPTGAATSPVVFEIEPGMSFRVLTVINSNKVTIESATEPGLTVRTVNSDKSTAGDWQPMDEQGTTQTADFIGWRLPPGVEMTCPSHGLTVGDVITVSARNNKLELYSGTSTDFYEQDWETIRQVTGAAGVTHWRVEDAEVTPSATAGDSQWEIEGSFYFDVDRANSAASELEDRAYVYTYVNAFGEEGPPSSASDFLQVIDGREVTVTGMSLPPTIGYDITDMRLYRTNSTEAGTEFQLVKEFSVSRTATDDVFSRALGEIISSTTWEPPPAAMRGLTSMPNGMIVGFKGKQLYFCEPYFPHAWPAEYDQAVDYDIVGLATFGNSVVALTEGWPYIVTGSHPRNVNIRPIKINQACVSKRSIATDSDKVYYASPDGIVEVGVNGIRIATEDLMDKSDWESYDPTTIVAEFYEGRYYAFYDFDTTVVDSVRSAEVSGTITDADESAIVEGGRTIILTLTNDQWVPAGTGPVGSTATTQAIIDGLVASATPALGWNNKVIAGAEAIQTSDVVRTNDTTVTITLPASSSYAINSAEVIQPTIPNAALLVSNSDLTTRTFTIEPDANVATITLSGSLAGTSEAAVVGGTHTLLITVTNDKWISPLGDTLLDDIAAGIKATTNEENGWNDVMPQLITTKKVKRTRDDLVTVTIPEATDYSITENESIYVTIPHEALQAQQDVDVVSSNSVAIIATGAPAAQFAGTVVTAGCTEAEIVAGGKTVDIELTNETWIAAGTGPIGTTAQSIALRDALLSTGSADFGWTNVVVAGIDIPGDLSRVSDTLARFTLDAESTYSIADNETISLTIPGDMLTGGEDLIVSNTFGIQAQTPTTATLSGTITASVNEADIVTGGKTIIITLSDDTWAAAGTGPIGSTADTQALIDAMAAATSPTDGWNYQIITNNIVTPSHVERTDDTTATITLPAMPTYDTAAQEVVTITIPDECLVTSAVDVVVDQTFTIDQIVPVTAAVTGTVTTSATNEGSIIAGGKTIIITLSNDTWVGATDPAEFAAVRSDIIQGLDSDQAEAAGWNNKVRDVIAVTSVVRTSDYIVTITLPAVADYDPELANETITVTVPASALELSAAPCIATPTFVVEAQDEPTTCVLSGTITSSTTESDIVAGGKTIVLTLADDTWVASGATFDAQRQNIIDGLDGSGTEWDAERSNIPVTDVVRTDDTVVTITLSALAGYDLATHPSSETITATIPASALSISTSAVVATTTPTISSVAPPDPTAALTGTITSSTVEGDIVTGGKTVVLTLTNDTWETTLTDEMKQDIYEGVTNATASPAYGWNNAVLSALSASNVSRDSDTEVTITLPAVATYDIGPDGETISAVIPISATTTATSPISASGSATITYTPYVEITDRTITQKLPGQRVYSGIQFKNDGTIWAVGPSLEEAVQIDASEWYGDLPLADIGDDYEVRFLSAGATYETTGAVAYAPEWDGTSPADDTWTAITSNPMWRFDNKAKEAPRDPPNSGVSKDTITGTFEIRAAGVGSALTSATIACVADNLAS